MCRYLSVTQKTSRYENMFYDDVLNGSNSINEILSRKRGRQRNGNGRITMQKKCQVGSSFSKLQLEICSYYKAMYKMEVPKV